MTKKAVRMLVLNKGDMFIDELIKYAENTELKSGSFYGIGALKNPILGFYDLETKKYKQKKFDGFYEVVSLVGNITKCDDKYIVHTHVALSDSEYHVIGGHLIDAIVGITVEISILSFDEIITRQFNPDLALNLITIK